MCPPINLEYSPLEAVRSSFLVSKPSLTYTLIRPWCKSTSKTLLIMFFKLLFLESYGCRGAFGEHSPLSQVVLPCSFYSLLLAWVTCGRGHHYWVIFRHEARWPLKGPLFALAHYWTFLKTIVWSLDYFYPSLMDDTHIVRPMNEITHAFDHISTQLALIELRVKVSKCKFWNPSKISLSIEVL